MSKHINEFILKLIKADKPEHATDVELVSRCLKEDRVAQRALYNRYARMMFAICYRYADSQVQAEDMLQEGFILVFNNLDKFRHESSLKTWMTRIMINAAINYLKKWNKINWKEDLDVVKDKECNAEMQLHYYDSNVIMECIQQLPHGYRLVINLYAIEGFLHKEIAAQLGVKEVTSRSQYVKAKRCLAKLLAKKGIIVQNNEAL